MADLCRQKWISYMREIVDPVFDALSEGRLCEKMPVRFYGTDDRAPYAALEAFGRAFCGFAPFLNNFERDGEEEALAAAYRKKLIACFDKATDPTSPDYMNFGQRGGEQPLVDAAFLAHGLVRSADFVATLDEDLKKQIIEAFKVSRCIVAHESNWLLFSGMVEAGIHVLGGEADMMRVAYCVRQHHQWFHGDGLYGDGAAFHMDYYNSFVIQPMLIDICRVFRDRVIPGFPVAAFCDRAVARASRYAEILERMIAHDGTYTCVGRSLTYRFGAFQLLAQSCLQHFCQISPAMVRCALTVVIDRVMESNIFDEDGWLLHGIYGEQPSLAEPYINTGSLYLCSAVFLPLGLPESDPFWSGADEMWTSKKIVAGINVAADHAR
jgi:hypothetical protein